MWDYMRGTTCRHIPDSMSAFCDTKTWQLTHTNQNEEMKTGEREGGREGGREREGERERKRKRG